MTVVPSSASSPNLVLPLVLVTVGVGTITGKTQVRFRSVGLFFYLQKLPVRPAEDTEYSLKPSLGQALQRKTGDLLSQRQRGDSESSSSDRSGTSTRFEFRLVQTVGPGTHNCKHDRAGGFEDCYILESTFSTSSSYCLKSKLADCMGEDPREAAGQLVHSGATCS